MIQLNSKKINQLETIAQVILALVLLGCLFLDVYKSSLLTYLIGVILIHQGARSLKAKFDPEALAREDEEEKKLEATKQVIKIRPTLVWGLCELMILIVLGISWVMVMRGNLLDNEEINSIIVGYTFLSALYLVISYYPKTIGGTIGVKGMKQVNQLLIRSHAISLIAAIILLLTILRDKSTVTPVDNIMGGAQIGLVVLLFLLFFWKYLIHRAK